MISLKSGKNRKKQLRFPQKHSILIGAMETLSLQIMEKERITMDIKARIPGTITSIKVNVGDAVKARDIVGTMEAMKMEQPIPAPKEGTVKEIKVAVGDKVKTGEVIVVLE
jgi:biotin carboxyl carrier protein